MCEEDESNKNQKKNKEQEKEDSMRTNKNHWEKGEKLQETRWESSRNLRVYL